MAVTDFLTSQSKLSTTKKIQQKIQTKIQQKNKSACHTFSCFSIFINKQNQIQPRPREVLRFWYCCHKSCSQYIALLWNKATVVHWHGNYV